MRVPASLIALSRQLAHYREPIYFFICFGGAIQSSAALGQACADTGSERMERRQWIWINSLYLASCGIGGAIAFTRIARLPLSKRLLDGGDWVSYLPLALGSGLRVHYEWNALEKGDPKVGQGKDAVRIVASLMELTGALLILARRPSRMTTCLAVLTPTFRFSLAASTWACERS